MSLFTRFAVVAFTACRLAGALTYHGADFSSLINLENDGQTYNDGGSTQPFEKILANHGTNLARIRIWTSDSYDEYSLQYGLDLAKRASAAGMAIMVDLHYSDTCESAPPIYNAETHLRKGRILASKRRRPPGPPTLIPSTGTSTTTPRTS